jgi:type IV secretion system protein TrbL
MSGTANGASAAETARSPAGGNTARETNQAAPSPATSSASGPAGTPDWARQLRAEQTARHHRQTAVQTLKEGDGGGASANPDIDEKEE